MTAGEQKLLVLLGLAAVGAWLYSRSQKLASDPNAPPPSDATSFLSNPVAAMTELITPWYQAGSSATWVPVLNGVENAMGIPTNLLARQAYQESRFREEIIRGTKTSTAGARGIMQLMPQYFPVVANATPPYTDDQVVAQINTAAQYLVTQYETFGSWQLALAAYNAGPGNVKKYGGVPPFGETQDYVAQITADVPEIANA